VFLGRNEKLCLVTLLLAATAASAAPTAVTVDAVAPAVEMALDTTVVTVPDSEVAGPVDAKLANLGRELLQPPNFAVLSDTRGNHVKPLPAVPAAILMVLSGFLCISLVRDRRFWLAALTGLLWAGQVGINVLPQLALRFSQGNHSQQQFSAELNYPHCIENSNRLRSDIEGTQYIGLLHHLAGIPDVKSFHKATTHTYTAQPAIILARIGLDPLIVCLASMSEQLISFSPAFIFINLARGPPILT
jgi:hypothetical protein